MGTIMFDSPLISTVTIVMLLVLVVMVSAIPALTRSNHALKAKLDARNKRLTLDDGY